MKTSKLLTTTPTSDRRITSTTSAVQEDPFHEYQVNIMWTYRHAWGASHF